MDNNLEWVSETKRMIDDEGGTSIIIPADVTDEEACQSVVEKTVEVFGALHVLVNIGGFKLCSPCPSRPVFPYRYLFLCAF